jgi:hypothetical protein
MREKVQDLDLGVIWDPNAPEAILLANDFGRTVLALNPHLDDLDQRCVVIVWTGTRSARLSAPNDEAISGHRLWRKGLEGTLWAGQVSHSHAIRDLERQNRVHPRHDPSRYQNLAHHVLLLKERVAEIVAEAVSTRRCEGNTLEAATTAMRK